MPTMMQGRPPARHWSRFLGSVPRHLAAAPLNSLRLCLQPKPSHTEPRTQGQACCGLGICCLGNRHLLPPTLQVRFHSW